MIQELNRKIDKFLLFFLVDNKFPKEHNNFISLLGGGVSYAVQQILF
jgi:hypothetical protein